MPSIGGLSAPVLGSPCSCQGTSSGCLNQGASGGQFGSDTAHEGVSASCRVNGRDLNGDNVFTNDFLHGKEQRTIRPESSWENMYRTFDVRLTKTVGLGGDRKVSVSAEAFNIFNFTNYSTWDGRQREGNGNVRAGFNQYTGVFAPRQAQVGMRYEF